MKLLKSKWVIGIVIILIVCILGYAIFHRSPKYQFVSVTSGPIDESVSLTGNTTPIQSVSLSFSASGVITNIYSSLGKKVNAGQLLAELDTSDLKAQLQSAEAGFALALAGTSTNTTNLANITSQQDALVENAHRTLLSSGLQAIPTGTNSAGAPLAPIISGLYNGPEGNYTLHFYSSAGSSGVAFSVGGLETGYMEPASPNITVPIGTNGLYITFGSNTNTYLSSNNTDWIISIPNTKSTVYTANYNTYVSAQENRDQVIAQAQASIGTSATNQSVSQAQIAQAQANIDSINAKIKNTKIIAPVSGVVTQFDAKVGQLATPSVPLISIISSGGYEVDAGVSETDIGKVALGDKVSMTLDAFSGETFTGSVFYIAPSETNEQGVISYLIKISFDKNDARLKSGLTANISIQTKHKDKVLILPQYAILQNDQGTYVETLENKKVVNKPITLGIQDEKGNVEIVSGVTDGEQVLNIGLKVQ